MFSRLLLQPQTVNVESVMSRMRSYVPSGFTMPAHKVGDSLFGKVLTETDIAAMAPQPVLERKPASHEFTPAQQMAMLYLRKSDLSKLVYAKLLHSTVRASAATYHELTIMRYAEPKGDGFHRLTWLGWNKANDLADELAKEFSITVPRFPSLAALKRRGAPRWNGMGQSENG